MPKPKTLLNDAIYAEVETSLKAIKESDIVLKLICIKSLKKNLYQEVSEQFGVSRISLTKWVKAFIKDGVDGLRKKPTGHMQSKLSKEHLEIINQWLTESKTSKGELINWTIPKLMTSISQEFGVEISHTPLWLQIRKLGMRIKSPRPMHKKTSKEIQEAFKKN